MYNAIMAVPYVLNDGFTCELEEGFAECLLISVE